MVVAHPPAPGGVGAETPVLRVSVLGRFEARVGDRLLAHADWQRLSAERLVKLLLVTRGHALPRERATELLWPDADPAGGSATFRKALHYAHRALDGCGVLTSDARTIALDDARLDLDLDRLGDAFAAVECAADETRQAAAIATILDLGAADLLPDDPYEEWLVGPRERLRSRWQSVALVAAQRSADRGDTARALEIVDQVLERDPTDEAAHRLAIALYARDGRHHAARRQYQLCREALRGELDVEPSDETRAAFEAAERAARSSPATPRLARLVARRAELEEIEPLLDRVAGGRAAGLVLRGPVGIGKTRLLREVAAYAGAAGWRVAWWQATDTTRTLPYAQTAAALAAVAPGRAAAFEEPGRSAVAMLRSAGGDGGALPFMTPAALIAGIVSAFDSAARDGPVMIAIDDLPWLHEASLEALRAVHGALTERPLLVAATCRDGDPWPFATTAFVEEVRRAGGLELAVGPLGPRDTEPLIVANLGGSSVQPDLARSVHAESAGNPLFCLEIVQAARDHGAVRLESGRWSQAPGVPFADIPATVQRLVAERSGSLSPATRDLLAMAAELGPTCSYPTLAAVTGVSNGELLAMIDEAVTSGLLVERGGGYGFSHPLYRRAVAERPGKAHRATRQLAIAAALAGSGARSATPAELQGIASRHPNPASVAGHALDAAAAGLGEAGPLGVAFGFAAGERLWRLFDRAGAEPLLERSLDAWRRLDPAVAAQLGASRACRVVGELRSEAGNDAAARAALLDAVALARDPTELAAAYRALHWAAYRHGDFEGAHAILDEGVARLPAGAPAERAELEAHAGWCLVRLGRHAEALPVLERSVAALASAGRPPELMRALDLLGDLLGLTGRFDEAIERLGASLAIALEIGDARGEILARIHLGGTLTRSGRPGRARPHLARARELAHLVGDRYVDSVASWLAANAEHALGNRAGAADLRRRELALLAELGGNPHHEAMSHAHLAHLARLAGSSEEEAREAAAARQLAPLSSEPGYPGRIEAALAADDWSALRT